MDKIKYAILTIIAIATFLAVMNYGIKKHEENECYQWAKESEKIAGYYMTQWQVDQCANYVSEETLKHFKSITK